MAANQSVRLSDAIEDFVRFRRSMDLSKATIKQDESTLRIFMSVVGNVWVHTINTAHVSRFFEEGAKTRQPQTQRNDHTRLSMFFDWARETGRMPRDNNPLYGRRKPRQAKKERQRLHVSKFDALLDAAEERDPRDRIAVALMLYTLARDGEVAAMRIRDVDLNAGYLHKTIFKTRDEDMVPICSELDAELRRWLVLYQEHVGHLEPNHYLVPSRDTGPVFDDGGKIVGAQLVKYRPDRKVAVMGKIAKPALEKVGFAIKDERGKLAGEGAHTLRRSGARALFDRLIAEGVDFALEIVQSMLGHANLVQTQVYIGFRPSRHKRDDLIKGRPLYAVENVTRLDSVREA